MKTIFKFLAALADTIEEIKDKEEQDIVFDIIPNSRLEVANTPNPTDPLVCPTCGFTAKSKAGLSAHIRSRK